MPFGPSRCMTVDSAWYCRQNVVGSAGTMTVPVPFGTTLGAETVNAAGPLEEEEPARNGDDEQQGHREEARDRTYRHGCRQT